MLVFPEQLFCGGIFGAEQAVGSFVLLNRGETAHRRIEAVIVRVVVALAYFANQDGACARLDFKIMIHTGLDGNAHPRLQLYLRSGGNLVSASVYMNRYSGSSVD